MNSKIYLFIFYISICLSSVNAQIGRYYSSDKELSSSLINQLFQDKQGFIWIATEFGLNKYDGYRFFNYIHQPEDETTIKNNYVRTLFETEEKRLLIGCINGLMEYNREEDYFIEIPLFRDNKQVYPHIAQLCQLNNGDILIATVGQGIFKLDTQINKAYSHDLIMNKIDYYYHNSIYEDANHNIWIGTENNGLIGYFPKTDKIGIYKYPNISDNNISAIIEDEKGNLLIGTKRGLSKYDKKRDKFIAINGTKTDDLSIYCLSLVNNQVLVGTDGQGLKIYNSDNNTIDDIKLNSAPIDFSNGKVHSILRDNNDNLWIGLFQKGIVFIPKLINPFHYYGSKSIFDNPIGESCVMSIYEDSNNNIWVGTDNEGLFELDQNGKQIRHLQPNRLTGAIANTIMCTFEDSEGNFWIGSYSKGIAKLNRSTGLCEYTLPIKNEKIFSITEDRDKNLYIATYGSGFYKYNLITKRIDHYESSKDEKNDLSRNELANDWINYIFCDKEGLIWLGHYKGVSCFNPKTESFINFKNCNTIITNKVGYVITEDYKGNIWAGTTDGLYYFDKRTEDLTIYTQEHGLPNNVICGICEDNNKNIWVSTYMGISKFDTNSKCFVNYYASDGLQGNEFMHGSFLKSKNGKFYFGGTNGISHFDPLLVTPILNQSEVWITDFYISDKRIYKGIQSGNKPVIYHSVIDANLFQLSYRDNTFSLVFSTLQYNNLDQIAYQYRIEELSNQWSTTEPGENRVTYNNLPAGKYTFLVRAINHGEASDTKLIKIIISPPWYQTWWAYCLYSFIIFLILYGIYKQVRSRMNHKRELMKREHTEQLNEAKLQYFINISHEIRTPMTLIINPLEKLISNATSDDNKKTYSMIYRNAQRILRLINQLMDVRKLDKGQMHMIFRKTNIISFINDVMLTFEDIAKKKNIKFICTHPISNTQEVWIDTNNFDKVLMNVLSNAFKYTPENGEISIVVNIGHNDTDSSVLKDYLEIEISDSGIGIDTDKIEFIFERFYQINNDVTQSTAGTGIGLHLCRSLVKLHHGEIIAKNRKDTPGSCFTIRIPLGSNHLNSEEIENHDIESSTDNIPKEVEKLFIENFATTQSDNKQKIRAKSNKWLLIVEDEEEIRDYLHQQLSEEYQIKSCKNGKEAYDLILSNPPHLVLSDVMMPEMDGLTLCRKIKQNININHIPVILLTAKSRQEDKIEGMEIGADAYCIKPFNMEVLKTTITNLIQNRHLLQTKFSGAQTQDKSIAKIELKTSDEILMEKIMKTINQHIANPNFNVEMLAEEVGLSRVHVYRKLKELTNVSARDFIKNIRLKQASILLKEKGLSISDVAYATGFTTLSHFSTSFKELYGVSPTDFKMNSQERTEC